MKKRDLDKLGLVGEAAQREAVALSSRMRSAGIKKAQFKEDLANLAKQPEPFQDDPFYGELAALLLKGETRDDYAFERAPFQVWGEEEIDADAVSQLVDACELPISVRGALMPDAHVGYGLPIGGVLAAEGAVIPYAVGVDIACRVKLSVFDIPASELKRRIQPLSQAIEKNTSFGLGARFKHPKDHPVMEKDWGITPRTRTLKDQYGWPQLGTSGSGNHFVEFGEFELKESFAGLEPGSYLALVSHSGSRGAGARVAKHYSDLARSLHPDLPKKFQHLAWLDLSEPEGEEYWAAMELMGEYASANHYLIHRDITKAIGAQVLAQVENHHNFAWKEEHDGKELIVHRKGATPAGEGELGYIPGTMLAPGFLVEGTGSELSLRSCAHGAGRKMSRKKASNSFTHHGMRKELEERGITLLSGGLDEAPGAYKDINRVMSHQHELVKVLGKFQPKIVKMAPDGERAED